MALSRNNNDVEGTFNRALGALRLLRGCSGEVFGAALPHLSNNSSQVVPTPHNHIEASRAPVDDSCHLI